MTLPWSEWFDTRQTFGVLALLFLLLLAVAVAVASAQLNATGSMGAAFQRFTGAHDVSARLENLMAKASKSIKYKSNERSLDDVSFAIHESPNISK